MTDWLSVCRLLVGDLERLLGGLPYGVERERVVGAGMGGDETTAVDEAAEEAAVARLEALHADGVDFTLVSEELGERRFGDARARVVLDPIDGSVNAKRGIPFFAVSVAVADGDAMRDVVFGFVHDFGTGEEWTATRGKGAFLNGQPLAGAGPRDKIEILSFEATRTDLVAETVGAMVGFAERVRIMGSLALSLCHLAAGRVDAVCSLKAARSVDIAAAQLLVSERGLAVDLPENGAFGEAPLDLGARSRVVAAATPALCAELYARLSSSR